MNKNPSNNNPAPLPIDTVLTYTEYREFKALEKELEILWFIGSLDQNLKTFD